MEKLNVLNAGEVQAADKTGEMFDCDCGQQIPRAPADEVIARRQNNSINESQPLARVPTERAAETANSKTGKVTYPGIVDQKTLAVCLQTAEQIIREPLPNRVERFRRTKEKLFAQVKAHPLSFDEWNSPDITSKPDSKKSTTPLLKKIVEICDLGSAQEFGDADERLRAIRGLIIGEAV